MYVKPEIIKAHIVRFHNFITDKSLQQDKSFSLTLRYIPFTVHSMQQIDNSS